MQLTTEQTIARDLLSRALGISSGNATDYLLSLDNEETADLAAAAPRQPGDVERVRQQVKAIVAKANERRGADEGRAGLPLATAAATRNGARELLQLHFGLAADDAAVHEARLTSEQRSSLGELALQRRYAMANFQSDPVPAATVRGIVGADLLPSLSPASEGAAPEAARDRQTNPGQAEAAASANIAEAGEGKSTAVDEVAAVESSPGGVSPVEPASEGLPAAD